VGLIGLLALIAAVTLAVSGRYPQRIFELVMGLNRVLRGLRALLRRRGGGFGHARGPAGAATWRAHQAYSAS
jgi:hypothetical protein